MFTQDSITILTSEQIAVHMSKASDKGLTVEQKATLHRDNMGWKSVQGDPFSLTCKSPRSGKPYKVTINPITLEVHCSCACKGRCYHAVCFTWDFKPLFEANRANRYTANVSTAPAVSAATYAADWGA